MAGQGLITRMQSPLPTGQNCDRHGGRIVPPQLSWYRAKKLEGLNHSVQDCFDPFGWQRDRKRAIGMSPGQQQHVDHPTTVGEVDIDVAKVGFGPLSRRMVQRQEGLAFTNSMLDHVATNLVIATQIPLFDNAAKELHCRMALLRWCRLVGLQNLINHRNEGPQLRRRRGLGACIRLWFRCL